jgi:threonine/homoserine/homoserine lactone efflux protein
MSGDLLIGLFHFVAAYSLVLIVPGTIMVTAGSIAAFEGLGRAANFIAGVAAGAGAVTACAGLAADVFLRIVPALVVQAAGASVLLLAAAMMLRTPAAARRPISPATSLALAGTGMVAALTSPLTAVFTTTMFSGPLASSRAPIAILLAALLVAAANLCWYGALAAFVSRPAVRFVLLKRQGATRAGSAAILVMLAVLTLFGANGHLPG